MADKKISALNGATTPLAGTEVLPIVQGGATVKVAVSNLTAGRAVAVSSLTSTGNIQSGSGTDQTNLLPKELLFYNTSVSEGLISSADDASTFTSIGISKSVLRFATLNTERLNIGSNGDVTISTSNLVVGTAGKGVTLTSPNGLVTKTLTIDNAGAIVLI